MVMTPFQTYTTVRYAEKLNRIEMAEATALIMAKRLTPPKNLDHSGQNQQ
jgi:hypothetical protein